VGRIYEPSKEWDKREQILENIDQGIDRYFESLKELFKTASKAEDEAAFKYAMDRAKDLTKKSEQLITDLKKYTGEKQETSILDFLYGLFDGLTAMSRGDLEAAKIQVEFMSNNIENDLKEKDT